MLHKDMSCFMAKSVVWHNVTSKQDRHFIVLFWTVILFNWLNVNMFFLFVCLWDCKYLLFCCVSDTLAGDFLLHSCSLEGKSSCATHSMIFAKKNRNYFSPMLPTVKIKIREKIIPMFLRQNRKNLATQKYPIIRYFRHRKLIVVFYFKYFIKT